MAKAIRALPTLVVRLVIVLAIAAGVTAGYYAVERSDQVSTKVLQAVRWTNTVATGDQGEFHGEGGERAAGERPSKGDRPAGGEEGGHGGEGATTGSLFSQFDLGAGLPSFERHLALLAAVVAVLYLAPRFFKRLPRPRFTRAAHA